MNDQLPAQLRRHVLPGCRRADACETRGDGSPSPKSADLVNDNVVYHSRDLC
jgi:hypothetical protein